jgi:hypothetical protein
VTSQRARSVLGSCRISAASTARPAESIRAGPGAAQHGDLMQQYQQFRLLGRRWAAWRTGQLPSRMRIR